MDTSAILPGSLIVLCGIAASGKSTFAQQHFKPTQIVSSDACRAMISDDPSNQRVSGQAFDLMHWIIEQRLELRRTTVADSTALSRQARRDLLKIARAHGVPTVLIFFDIDPSQAISHDQRRDRQVGPEVIRKQHQQFAAALQDAQQEGWDQIVFLDNKGQKAGW